MLTNSLFSVILYISDIYNMSGCTCLGICACSAVALTAIFFGMKQTNQPKCNHNCNEKETKVIGDELV